MAGAGAAHHSMTGSMIAAAVIAVVLIIRFRRVNQDRRLELGRLWIVPALYAAIAAAMFVTTPPGETGWLLCAAGLAVGAPLGWLRGRMMHIKVDPETRELSLRQSPAAFLFLVALIAVRSGSRAMLAGGTGGALHLSTAGLADLLVGLALGVFAMQRLEMYLRARRLLAEAGPA